MKKTKQGVSILLSAALVLSLIGCNRGSSNKDVEGAINTFNTIVKTYPKNKGFHKALSHWGFKLPTGEKFEWTKDTSANKADFAMVILADPLIKAGLDVNKLDKSQWLFKPAAREEGVDLPNLLVKPYNVSDKSENSNGSEDAFRRLLKQEPDLVIYHKEQQHYRLILGDGNEVEWTEKLRLNDADMTFVIKLEPLVKAGLDIKKLEGTGWIFKAAGKDNTGMGENPDQIIKVFKLNN